MIRIHELDKKQRWLKLKDFVFIRYLMIKWPSSLHKIQLLGKDATIPRNALFEFSSFYQKNSRRFFLFGPLILLKTFLSHKRMPSCELRKYLQLVYFNRISVEVLLYCDTVELLSYYRRIFKMTYICMNQSFDNNNDYKNGWYDKRKR